MPPSGYHRLRARGSVAASTAPLPSDEGRGRDQRQIRAFLQRNRSAGRGGKCRHLQYCHDGLREGSLAPRCTVALVLCEHALAFYRNLTLVRKTSQAVIGRALWSCLQTWRTHSENSVA